MPDPISPASSPAHTIDLEPVVVTATPSKPASATPLPIWEIATECAGPAATTAFLVFIRGGAANPPLVAALATGIAAGSLGACVAESINRHEEQASIRRAIDRCVAEGGTPLGEVDHTLTCQVAQ